MKTIPCKKTMASVEALLTEANKPIGMIGYVAAFHSHMPNRKRVKAPMMIKQSTRAESHGAETPPYCRPNNSMRVPPTTSKDPIQSMAFSPCKIGVRGVLISRKKRRMKKASPSKGKLRAQLAFFHNLTCSLHLLDVEAPPPRDILGESSTDDGTDTGSDSPDTTNHTVKGSAHSHGE